MKAAVSAGCCFAVWFVSSAFSVAAAASSTGDARIAASKATTSPMAAQSSAELTCSSRNELQPDVDLVIPFTGLPGTANERSFVAIKPDGIQRSLVGDIVSRFEHKGWKLVALKMINPTPSLIERHYEQHKGKAFFDSLVSYLSSSPVVAMVWEGPHVILGGRKLLGSTHPLDAEVGSIRGDLCTIAGKNLVHASDGSESAEREIALWFKSEEICSWTRAIDPWINVSL